MRINKFLAQCNVASRRKAEELILNGKISVNGEICTNLATQITENDVVEFAGKLVSHSEEKIYIAMNKPTGYLVTRKDTHGRPTIYDLLPEKFQNLIYVGRLDYESEGLIFLTNDGNWANQITHPKYKLPKTYEVVTKNKIENEQIKQLESGILIEDKKTLPATVKQLKGRLLLITISEGRKRQVRLMIQAIGSGVFNLKRIQIGDIKLDKLPIKNWRKLSPKEVQSLTP
jgi:23S rRNA pseudouridine2605 synthase